jgi:hypothetical protein
MRRLLLAGLIVLVAAAGLWMLVYRREIGRQLACYRVGSADAYELARQELAWIETGPDQDGKLRSLVARWGTGNERLDLYLARYALDPASSEAYREAFSLEMAWRPELLGDWGHYWSWRTADVAEEIASIRRYHDALSSTQPPRSITWRDVLILQAVFHVTGQGKLAERLTPKNWVGRYRRWLEAEAQWNTDFTRPQRPLPGA